MAQDYESLSTIESRGIQPGIQKAEESGFRLGSLFNMSGK